MDYVSLIKADPPSRVSKQFRLDASGKLEKTAVAQLVEGRGKTVVIETAEKMGFDTEENTFSGTITLKVKTKSILEKLINRLKKINGIEKVNRE